MIEERLPGGGVNEVVRVGGTVRRPTGHWTPAVHRLLEHLAEAGFEGAPRVHGIDERGREILDFVPGDVAHYPLPEYAWSDAALEALAKLMRSYHDATTGFRPPEDARWYFPAREPAEVLCHGDIAPYNCVYRDGLPVAFIDFDTAHPGPRLWDVAHAAYRFVPLSHNIATEEEQIRRLRLLCDAYGLTDAERAALPEAVAARLRGLVDHIHEQAAAGSEAFAAHLAAGHADLYLSDLDHVTRHAAAFRTGITP
jgi:hypothetical protein